MPWFLHAGYLFLAGMALVFVVLLRIQALPFWLAQKPLQLGHYNQALQRLNLLEQRRFRSPALHYFKATVLMFAERNAEAEEVFQKCPQDSAQKSIVLVNLGYVLLGQKRFEDAARALDEAIKLRPNGAVAYSTRAEIYLQQGIESQKPLELLDRGIEYKQGSENQSQVDRHIFGYLHANRAWALFLLGRHAEAEQAVEAAERASITESKPGMAGVHYHIARALLAGGQAPRAVEQFRQARQIDPNGKYAALAEAALSKDAVSG
ncbi:MAG: hypothetical protein JWO48_1819 [Bryobacterales bacterium]|nr:hypothetical protein [Bryobacterales bacterium]